MRRQYINWMIFVFGVVLTGYGLNALIYNLSKGKGLSVLALVFFIVGTVVLLFMGSLYLYDYIYKKKHPAPKQVEKKPEVVETPKEEIKPVETQKKVEEPKKALRREYEYTPNRSSSYSSSSYASTVYVKQVGYGPILRITGNQIVDMRNNTYYRLESNMVKQEGYGPLYEIRGNQIKDAFGGYLYEISGSNINKVFGGFFASISGNYITTYDLSYKYEMTDSLSKSQILAAVALLFGRY